MKVKSKTGKAMELYIHKMIYCISEFSMDIFCIVRKPIALYNYINIEVLRNVHGIP